MPIPVKVDVYSDGILLLKIICWRNNFDEHVDNVDQLILACWAYDFCMQKKLNLQLDKDGEAMEDVKMMENYVIIAMWYIQRTRH
ncbi:hypothetical protein FF1_028850 [Malus domestica]